MHRDEALRGVRRPHKGVHHPRRRRRAVLKLRVRGGEWRGGDGDETKEIGATGGGGGRVEQLNIQRHLCYGNGERMKERGRGRAGKRAGRGDRGGDTESESDQVCMLSVCVCVCVCDRARGDLQVDVVDAPIHEDALVVAPLVEPHLRAAAGGAARWMRCIVSFGCRRRTRAFIFAIGVRSAGDEKGKPGGGSALPKKRG